MISINISLLALSRPEEVLFLLPTRLPPCFLNFSKYLSKISKTQEWHSVRSFVTKKLSKINLVFFFVVIHSANDLAAST